MERPHQAPKQTILCMLLELDLGSWQRKAKVLKCQKPHHSGGDEQSVCQNGLWQYATTTVAKFSGKRHNYLKQGKDVC